jgi:DNA-binding response OmpR family regulator
VNEAVLIVEDDPSIREVTALGLREAGYRVTTAPDGREGLLRARRDQFDLVILDIMLPYLDGLEVCREIRKESGVPVLMLTAKGDTVDVVVGLESGADDYVTKPFDPAELSQAVTRVLTSTKAELAYQREHELDKAEMLSQLETLFEAMDHDSQIDAPELWDALQQALRAAAADPVRTLRSE